MKCRCCSKKKKKQTQIKKAANQKSIETIPIVFFFFCSFVCIDLNWLFVNRECVSNEQWIEGKKRRCFHTKQRNIEQSIVSQCLCVFVCGTRAFVSTILVQHIVWFYNASKNGCIMDFIRKSQTKFAYGTNGPYVVQYVTPLVNIISNWGVLCIVYTACLRQPIKTNFGFSRYRCCFWFFFCIRFVLLIASFQLRMRIFFSGLNRLCMGMQDENKIKK